MAVGSVGGVYGLSGTGMDIDSIVKKLMMGQQAKSDALLQKKTVAQWQKTAYNSVYDDVSKFRDTVFNYKLQGTLSPNKVTSSNSSVATVSASADAADVTHSLVVAQLAGGVNLTSSGPITPDGANKESLTNQFGASGTYKFTITNGGDTSAEITIDPAKSINDLVSQINNAGINVKATYDNTLDRFFISTTNTGASAGIEITQTAGNDVSWGNFFSDKLQLDANILNDDNILTPGIKGHDAEFKLDGVPLSQSSNTFNISGVTYNLTGVSGDATVDVNGDPVWGTATATNISVTNDTDAAVASIKALVDSYNKIMADLNGKVNETRYKDFAPLTDAQKADMKDADIIAWEAKAKSGMLHNDTTLTSLVNSMRNAFSSPVSGAGIYNSASAIGITTSRDYLEGGKLHLDADKLRTALNADPDVLNKLFGAQGTTNLDGTIDSKTQGIAGRLYDGIKSTMNQLNLIASTTSNAKYDTSSSYANKISDYTKLISKASDRFDVMQTAYYKQFNAMEVALQQLTAQNSWLSSFGTTS